MVWKSYPIVKGDWELRHYDDGKITRGWYKRNSLGSELRIYPTDGTIQKQDLLFDIHQCFLFIEESKDEEVCNTVYETQLPKDFVINGSYPKNYRELFKILKTLSDSEVELFFKY